MLARLKSRQNDFLILTSFIEFRPKIANKWHKLKKTVYLHVSDIKISNHMKQTFVEIFKTLCISAMQASICY